MNDQLPRLPLPPGMDEKTAIGGSLGLIRLALQYAVEPEIFPRFVEFIERITSHAPNPDAADHYHSPHARGYTEEMAVWFVTNVRPENVFLTPEEST